MLAALKLGDLRALDGVVNLRLGAFLVGEPRARASIRLRRDRGWKETEIDNVINEHEFFEGFTLDTEAASERLVDKTDVAEVWGDGTDDGSWVHNEDKSLPRQHQV